MLPFVLLCVQGKPAAAEPHQPAGPWHVQFDGVQCVGLREYGTQSDPLTLALKPSPSGGVMRIILVRSGIAELSQFGETIRFDADKIDTNALYFEDESNTRRMVGINLPMPQFKAHLQTHVLGLEGAPFTGTFAVTDLENVVGGLDNCLVQLRDRWNIGDQYASRIATEAKGSLQGLLKASDYPRTALNREQEGRVAMTMLVDVDGTVPDCGVDETSGSPFLDVASCYYITHRAHLTPAVGRDGKPIRSSIWTRITWRIAH
jgi:hypothetical protein